MAVVVWHIISMSLSTNYVLCHGYKKRMTQPVHFRIQWVTHLGKKHFDSVNGNLSIYCNWFLFYHLLAWQNKKLQMFFWSCFSYLIFLFNYNFHVYIEKGRWIWWYKRIYMDQRLILNWVKWLVAHLINPNYIRLSFHSPLQICGMP